MQNLSEFCVILIQRGWVMDIFSKYHGIPMQWSWVMLLSRKHSIISMQRCQVMDFLSKYCGISMQRKQVMLLSIKNVELFI